MFEEELQICLDPICKISNISNNNNSIRVNEQHCNTPCTHEGECLISYI
jgi:hypothetical protein